MTFKVDLYQSNGTEYEMIKPDAKVAIGSRFADGRILHRLDVMIEDINMAMALIRDYRYGIRPSFKLVIQSDGEEDVVKYIGTKGMKLKSVEGNSATFETDDDKDEDELIS